MASVSRGVLWSIVVFVAVTLIFAMMAYVPLTPQPSERFFQLYVVGEGGKFEHYFPDDNATIRSGIPLQWHVGVTNLMGSVQYVAVKGKLANATTESPNVTVAAPAPVPAFIELERVLLQNETWEIPLTWKVAQTRQDGDVVWLALEINGVEVQPPVHAVSGKNFRMIFELWTLPHGSGDLSFGWIDRSNGEWRATWIQVWFNVTAT